MSAAGGEKRKTLEKWAFRGVCPSSFHFLSLSIYSKTYTEVSDPFYLTSLRKHYLSIFNSDKLPFEYADLDSRFR